jgi:hypothetical protein
MNNLLIAVNPAGEIADWGDPKAFTGHMLHILLEKGNVIRYVTEDQLKSSPLRPKEL